MTQREYLRVLGPFVLTTMTQPLLGAVDTAVMGRLPDPAYIAGVAVGAVIFNTVYWLLGFLRVGSTGFSAQAGDDPEQLRKAVLLPGLMALGLSLLILLLQHPIFAGAMLVLEPDEATRRVTAVYYDILIWGAPLALGNYVMLGWLMGRSLIAAALLMQIGGRALPCAAPRKPDRRQCAQHASRRPSCAGTGRGACGRGRGNAAGAVFFLSGRRGGRMPRSARRAARHGPPC